MITTEDLARELDVTTETITVLVDQIADDAELWDADAQLLTDAGAEIIRDQVATDDEPLMVAALLNVEAARTRLTAEREAADDAEQAYRAAIVAAVGLGHPRSRVAERAGITPQRVGQIYDGHR
jgi:hypothetical protein